jgi:hypothetical protein
VWPKRFQNYNISGNLKMLMSGPNVCLRCQTTNNQYVVSGSFSDVLSHKCRIQLGIFQRIRCSNSDPTLLSGFWFFFLMLVWFSVDLQTYIIGLLSMTSVFYCFRKRFSSSPCPNQRKKQDDPSKKGGTPKVVLSTYAANYL